MTKREAIRAVERGEADRICAPGEWVVWREGEVVMSKRLGRAARAPRIPNERNK